MKTKAIKVENREGVEMLVSYFQNMDGEIVTAAHIENSRGMQIVTFTPHQLADLITALHTVMCSLADVPDTDKPNEESTCERTDAEQDESPRVVVIESETAEQLSVGISKTSTTDSKGPHPANDGVFLNVEDTDGDHPIFFTTKQAIKMAQAILDIALEAQEGNERRAALQQ